MSSAPADRHRTLPRWSLAVALAVGVVSLMLGACATDAADRDGDGARNNAGLPCYAHDGPEPADLLDWRVEFSSTSDYSQGGPQIQGHAEVSCEVGIGILAGWWQWHELSSPDCEYVAVETPDGADSDGATDGSRIDPTEPILLNSGDVVAGIGMVIQDESRSMTGTNHPECFLEYLGTEPPTSP